MSDLPGTRPDATRAHASVKLLSNGAYHVVLTDRGSGFSRWRAALLTRWGEDASLDDRGSFLYLHAGAKGDAPWSATDRPAGVDGAERSVLLNAAQAVFDGRQGGWSIETTVAVDADRDVELRRHRITNHATQPRTLRATHYAEPVLASLSADSAHPAFSKLFVETEIHAADGAIVATRRPSKPTDERVWCFHRAVVNGTHGTGGAGAVPPFEMSFETSRPHFIGRGRSAADPAAVTCGIALAGHAGPVLDAVAAIQACITLPAGGSCMLDVFGGASDSREGCDALIRQVGQSGAGDRLLAESSRFRGALLGRLGACEADAVRYEALAAALLYADSALRSDAATIASNRRGQSALWAFGISGDVPVVLLELSDEAELALLDPVARAHAFLAAHAVRCEVMVLAEASVLEAARQRLADGAAASALEQRDGVFVRDAAALAAEEKTLLKSVARVALAGARGSFEQQIEGAASGAGASPSTALPSTRPGAAPPASGPPSQAPPADARGRFAFNGHGGFAPDLREYVIDMTADHMTPAPWVNILANPGFGSLISESGSAYTWSENAHEFRLTSWSNDPIGDPNTEAFYIRDDETQAYWSPTLLPTRGPGNYRARHGFGYSRFEHAQGDIESELCVFVAIDAPLKFSRLRLRNRSDRPRRLSLTGYAEWVLGDERQKTLMHVATELDAATGALFARNGYNADFADRTAFFDVQGAERSACGDRVDFFGRGGSLARPAALCEPRLSGRLGAALDPCAALRVAIDLAPGAEEEVVFVLGCGRNPEEAHALVQRSRGAAAAEEALRAVQEHWRTTLGAVQVRTPDPSVDAMANGWLIYQVINSRLWGRTGFYQSSGAYGFRDQLQDVMALVHCRPACAREHLLRAASRQFTEGDVQHWWHPPIGKGIRTRCSDDYLWLPFVAARYVEVTGDAAVLDAAAPFLTAPALKEDEASNYGLHEVAPESAPLYEHCVRAIRNGLRYGEHGLPLIGHGDWNDGMDAVGADGRGESVWLAFFLIAVLKRFAPLSRQRGDAAFADQCEQEAQRLAHNVEASSWDGAWYRRAYFDDGTPLGSAANTECQIDSIAQSWAVLSGAAPPARAKQAMDSVHERLVRTDTRLLQLLDPPFDTSKPSPGYIAGYVPGVRENGGQYTHAAMWTAMAFAALGDAERAWQAARFLNPVSHGDSAESIVVYKVEPYVLAGDVYSSEPHAGRGGWTWYSGSAGWMVQLLLESLLGLQRRGDRLRIEPLMPSEWPGFTLQYRFCGTNYEIECRRAASADAALVRVDGVVAPSGVIDLLDDGRSHAVVVDHWPSSGPRPVWFQSVLEET